MRHLIILIAAVFLLSCEAQEIKVSEFRGPDRSGIFNETGLLDSWPENGPEEVFYIENIGKGYGPPVISDDLMYFTGAIDSTSILFCFNLSGIMQWQKELGKEWVVNYPGSRSSPTVVNDLIYVGTGMGNLLCLNKSNQEILWSIDAAEDYQVVLPLFGHSESPLIEGDKVFWTLGGKKYNVLALNRFNGELIWNSTAKNERSAYNPPRVITSESGKKILVTFSAYHMLGLDVQTGEVLWSHEQDNYPILRRKPGYGDTHANTVVYEDGYIYYAEGDGNCGVKLSLSPDGLNLKEIWRNTKFDSYMGGIVKVGDYLYGSGTGKPSLLSINVNTGELTDSLAIGRGTIIVADEMIYYYSQRGSVNLVSFENGKMSVISNFKISKGSQEHFSHPYIYKGILYIRHGDAIMGYKIS